MSQTALTREQRAKVHAAKQAEQKLRKTAEQAATATAVRDTSVREAIAAGVKPAELARALKLSPQRILQIKESE